MNTADRTRREGNTLIAIIVILAVIGVVFYFISDPFSTKVDEATRQATQWTPENIQKDPVGYLTWAQSECDAIGQRLEAQALSLRTKMNQSSREATAKGAELRSYQQLFREAKEKYQQSASAQSWPADLRGISLTEQQLKKKIVEAHQRVEALTKLVSTYSQTSKALERKLAEVSTKQEETSQLKRKLSTDLEIAKVKKTVADIGAISDRLNAIMDTSGALVSTPEEPSLEDLVQPSQTEQIDAAFDQIMKQ